MSDTDLLTIRNALEWTRSRASRLVALAALARVEADMAAMREVRRLVDDYESPHGGPEGLDAESTLAEIDRALAAVSDGETGT